MPAGMRTLTGYGVGVFVVLAAVNAVAWSVGKSSKVHDIGVFSAGFLMGVIGTSIAANVYGYRRAR